LRTALARSANAALTALRRPVVCMAMLDTATAIIAKMPAGAN
jgi:hypothetical protein